MQADKYANSAEWVTVTEAAERFGTSRSTIYSMIRTGRVERVILQGRRTRVRVSVADLQAAFSVVHG